MGSVKNENTTYFVLKIWETHSRLNSSLYSE